MIERTGEPEYARSGEAVLQRRLVCGVIAALLGMALVQRGLLTMVEEGLMYGLPLGCICFAGVLSSMESRLPIRGKGAIPAGPIPPWSLRLAAWFLLAAMAYHFNAPGDALRPVRRLDGAPAGEAAAWPR